MNTREENVAEMKREADEIERKQQVRRADLDWARQWHDGCARCPTCGRTELGVVDLEAEGQLRYESMSCKGCGARWKVEYRESAVAILREDTDHDDDWIELAIDPFASPTVKRRRSWQPCATGGAKVLQARGTSGILRLTLIASRRFRQRKSKPSANASSNPVTLRMSQIWRLAMKYRVEVTRVAYTRQTVTIEAESVGEAEDLALNEAPEEEFCTYDSEYEISSAQLVSLELRA